MNNNLSTVLEYYKAINQKKPDLAAEKLANNIQLITPLANKQGKPAVIQALKGFCSTMDSLSITTKLASEDQVMLAYNITFPEPIGNLRAAGLLNLDNNLITRIELFYDGQSVLSAKDKIFS